MAGPIPRPFIDDVINRTDIVELINGRVPLRKTGSNYSACCPFHQEKTPSFSVSPNKQFYYCFGCGANGNAIGFLMEFDRLNFVEAVETLARHAGLPMPETHDGDHKQKAENTGPLYDIMAKANDYYQQQLRHHPLRDNAVNYLKQRGLSGQIAKYYDIGYAPPGWDNLTKQYSQEQMPQLIKSGLAIKKEQNNGYDRFRDRIMFPIRDTRARVIGFGGRVLGDDQPKYLNSPETPIYHKSQELYGLYEALHSRQKPEKFLIVEGYMDVIALAQFGIDYGIATCGTATSKQHLEKLFRYVGEIIFCFDGDEAGNNAAWRALTQSLPLLRDGRKVNFLFIPEGEDPDSLIRKEGYDSFVKRITQATPLSTFLFHHIAQKHPPTNLDSRAQFAQQALPLLGQIPSLVYQDMLLEQLAKLVKMDREHLLKWQGKEDISKQIANNQQGLALQKLSASSPIRRAISLLLHQPTLANCLNDDEFLAGLDLPGSGILKELITLSRQQPKVSAGLLLEHYDDPGVKQALAQCAAQELLISPEGLNDEWQGVITLLKQATNENAMEQLMAKGSQQTLTDDEKRQLQALLHQAKSMNYKDKEKK